MLFFVFCVEYSFHLTLARVLFLGVSVVLCVLFFGFYLSGPFDLVLEVCAGADLVKSVLLFLA
ncbi:hypothetical protein Hanom_Chr01g00086131 [Helianthus anomalus]